jgi:hypothetical protein
MNLRLVLLSLLLTGAPIAGKAAVSAVSREGNSILFKLSDGHAYMDWLTPGSFKVHRERTRGPMPIPPFRAPLLEIALQDSAKEIVLTTPELSVSVDKSTFAVTIRDAAGQLILRQWPGSAQAEFRFSLESSERFYGLGPGESPTPDVRGRRIPSEHPLLLSSRKYALYFPRSGRYVFDLGSAGGDSASVSMPGGDTVAWCFCWGGNLKDVIDRHRDCDPPAVDAQRAHTAYLAPGLLPAHARMMPGAGASAIRQAVNASLSGIPVPAVNAARLSSIGEQLAGAVMPAITLADGLTALPAAAALRRSLETHLLTYLQEANDRGFPVLHPLPFQFPADPEAARAPDEFLLGDELLCAPSFDMRARRVYLPQGIWTRLATGQVHAGRQWIEVLPGETELPIFARNGSIVPLNQPGRLELHYFPQLGAEYFIFEAESGEVTQTHASPAGDFLRLEVEEKVGREYDWVVHHADRPSSVESSGVPWEAAASLAALRPRQWHYDAGLSQLRIRLVARRGDDVIINAAFPDGQGVRSRPRPR